MDITRTPVGLPTRTMILDPRGTSSRASLHRRALQHLAAMMMCEANSAEYNERRELQREAGAISEWVGQEADFAEAQKAVLAGITAGLKVPQEHIDAYLAADPAQCAREVPHVTNTQHLPEGSIKG